jgi:hypothetical protein
LPNITLPIPGYEFPGLQCKSEESCTSGNIFAAKERKENKNNNLERVFFAIF